MGGRGRGEGEGRKMLIGSTTHEMKLMRQFQNGSQGDPPRAMSGCMISPRDANMEAAVEDEHVPSWVVSSVAMVSVDRFPFPSCFSLSGVNCIQRDAARLLGVSELDFELDCIVNCFGMM